MLHVDPEVLDDEAGMIEDLAVQFGTDLDARKSAVESLDWDGETREAFTTLFEETRNQLKDVEEQIDAIAKLLRDAKDGLIEADQSIAGGIRG